jgi:hypothetical protein
MLGFAMLYVHEQLKHGAPSIRRYGSVTLKLNFKVGYQVAYLRVGIEHILL